MNKTAHDFASHILASFPHNRCADLAARAAGGHLTSLELLALGILRGGREAEESVPGFLDAALAEYNHGSYRVPVRVVADWKRTLLVLNAAEGTSLDEVRGMSVALQVLQAQLIKDSRSAVVLQSGFKLEVYEVDTPAEAGVIVKEST